MLMITELPLFLFTTFAGLAAGSYVVGVIARGKNKPATSWLFPLICLILLGIGLMGTLAHLQRPERFLLALMQPTAMIAQEAYWSMGLAVVLVIDTILRKIKGSSPFALGIVGAVCATVLMFVMGYAYFASVGTPAWTTIATIPLFLVGDLAMGLAFYALFDKDFCKEKKYLIATAVVEALFLVTLIAEGVHFAGAGFSAIPFAIAAIIGPIGACALAYVDQRKPESKLAAGVFILALIGVCIARYTFYTGSIL